MTLADTLLSVWQQVLAEGKQPVELEGKTFGISRTRAKKLRTVRFDFEGRVLEGIEQNHQTASQWAALARKGQRIMQFSVERRYIGNVCEGKLTRYPAWFTLRLPE